MLILNIIYFLTCQDVHFSFYFSSLSLACVVQFFLSLFEVHCVKKSNLRLRSVSRDGGPKLLVPVFFKLCEVRNSTGGMFRQCARCRVLDDLLCVCVRVLEPKRMCVLILGLVLDHALLVRRN